MPFRPPLIAAACAGLLASAPALALSSSASVEIAGFSYQLIDLDLNDGIAPALSFTEQMLSNSFYSDAGGAFDVHEIDSFGTTAMARASGAARTSSGAGGSRAEASYSAGEPFQFQQFFAQNFYGWQFEITPSTGVLFRSTATLDATHQGDASYAVASARMAGYLTRFGDDAIELSDFTDSVLVEQGPRSYALSGYLHSGQQAQRGWMGIQTDASAYALPSPVPEPASWAMLLGGLAVLGWRSAWMGRARSAA